jgi:hypothetical protein
VFILVKRLSHSSLVEEGFCHTSTRQACSGSTDTTLPHIKLLGGARWVAPPFGPALQALQEPA